MTRSCATLLPYKAFLYHYLRKSALYKGLVDLCDQKSCLACAQVCEGLPTGEYQIKTAGPEDLEVCFL